MPNSDAAELPRRQRFTRGRLLRLLEEMESAAGAGVSVYLAPGQRLATMQVEPPELVHAAPLLERAMAGSLTGAAIFWGEAQRCLVLPPFPLGQSVTARGYHTEPLRSLLQADYTVALVLLRLGPYAVGVFQGDRLLASKTGSRLVHARHRKGGSSQRRFERGREKQMERLFGEVCTVARQRLEPYGRQIDYLIYGGEVHTVTAFQKQCDYLRQFRDRTLGRLLDIRRPKLAALPSAIEEVWSSDVSRFP